MFSNILIYFVVIPLVMMLGLALCRNIKQIRAVAVVGSVALTALSIWLLVEYLALRAAGADAPMLWVDSWQWFAPLNINLAVGVDGISIAMLILTGIILITGSFASWEIPQLRSSRYSERCLTGRSPSTGRMPYRFRGTGTRQSGELKT